MKNKFNGVLAILLAVTFFTVLVGILAGIKAVCSIIALAVIIALMIYGLEQIG